MATKPRTVQTSIHGAGLHVCGRQPRITECDLPEERVRTDHNYHPGFGVTVLRRDSLDIASWFDYDKAPTLAEIEREFIKAGTHQWTLKVDGPMVGYLLTRRKRWFWTVTKTDMGFA